MKPIYYLIFVFCCLSFCSCQKAGRTDLPDEVLLSHLLYQQPDSLAMLLEDQMIPAELSDSTRAEYGWWITRLHQLQKKSLVNDTIIHYTLRYYQEKQSRRLPSVYVLAAKQINSSGGDTKAEEQLLLKAVEEAENRNDTTQLIDAASELRSFYYRSGAAHQSIEIAKKIIVYTGNSLWDKMIYLYIIGLNYGELSDTDSMTHYMTEAINLSRKLKDEKEFYITRNYVDCLNAINQSQKALPILRELEHKFPKKHFNDNFANNFAYTNIWLNMGQLDSARVSLERLDAYCKLIGQKDNQNEYEIACIYVTMILRTAYNMKMNRPVNMLDIYRFSESVAKTQKNKAQAEQQQIVVRNKLENDNLQLKIKEEQARQHILYLLLIAGCTITVLVWLYQRKLLKKERSLQQIKEQIRLHRIALNENNLIIRQNEETIQIITSQLTGHNQLQEQLAEIKQIRQENELLQKQNLALQGEISRFMQATPDKNEEMDAYERMAEQNITFTQCAKQLSARLIEQHEELRLLQQGDVKHLSDIDWDQIYRLIDKVFNNYVKRLRNSFPLLTEEDIQCCCLIKLQLSTSAIARLYSIAPSSVTKRKQRIKERINQTKKGLLGKEQPVDVYIWGF